MVDALRECWRVVRPGGQLIDLRPLASVSPVELGSVDGVVQVGQIDGSPGAPHDRASDEALRTAHEEGRFALERVVRFDLYSHWDRPDDLFDRLTHSSRRTLPSEHELARIRWAVRAQPGARLRTRERMQLAVHVRKG